MRVEDPAPHRFAQLVGGTFLVAASIAAITGHLTVAWTLGWIVIALAFLNFAFDICVGCIVYAQLVRVGLFPVLGRRPAAGWGVATQLAPLIALGVLAVAAGGLGLQRAWQRRLVGSSLIETVAGGAAGSVPDILYFTGENCTVCHVA